MVDLLSKLKETTQRALLMVARGVLRKWDNSTGAPTVDVDLFTGETARGLEEFGTLGITSVPAAGTVVEHISLFLGGDRSHGVVVSTIDRANRPTVGSPGETIVWAPGPSGGTRIHCKADGSVEITPGGVDTVRINGDLEVSGDIVGEGDISADGAVEDVLCSMAQMRAGFIAHVHSGVTTGPGTSAIPTTTNC